MTPLLDTCHVKKNSRRSNILLHRGCDSEVVSQVRVFLVSRYHEMTNPSRVCVVCAAVVQFLEHKSFPT